ncbi:MAG: hypothetical protein GX455_14225 [Phycisphaerae bacterium]|nr:hypothetical protein [Phycisphaerae bacterium]
MAIVAPLSRYRRNNHLILLVVFLGLASWFYYDGHYNKEFTTKHTKPDGTPDDTLVINRSAPPYLLVGAFLVVANFVRVRNQRIRVDDENLNVNSLTIPLSSITQIDKTYFDSKGFFVLSYKSGGSEKNLKLYARSYDNLSAVLDRLIEELSGPASQEGKTQS